MDYVYRNLNGVVVRFRLNDKLYEVGPGENIIIPERYDYAIEAMGVKIEKDYDLSIQHDKEVNPHLWVSNPELNKPSEKEISYHSEPEPILQSKRKRKKS